MKPLSTILGQEPIETKQEICEKHGEFTNKKFMHGDKEWWAGCPKCALDQARQVSLACDSNDAAARAAVQRKKQVEIDASLGLGDLPKRYLKLNFEDLKITAATEHQQNQQIIFEVCKEYISDFKSNKEIGYNLVLAGNIGTGKTQIATIIAREVINQGYSVGFIELYNLLAKVKSAYSKTNDLSENQIIEQYASKDLLIIDEAKVEFNSDTERKIIMNLFNERYKRELPTIITTNLNKSQLKEMLTDRVVDRLAQNLSWLDFTWESYRRTAK
jgi:DNA replication protein DnaC